VTDKQAPTFRPRAFDDESQLLVIVGGRPRKPLRDLYHWLVRKPWWATIGIISGNFLVANLVFAVGYALVGGVHGAREGSVVDAFFFSVQTIGTLGYGAMYPETTAAHVLVVLEVMVGIVLTAIATGLVYTKFATPAPRVFFSTRAVVSTYDGVPTLMVRVGNERGDHVLDAKMRMVLTRTERTKEGQTYYRNRDLRLVREHAATFRRGMTLMHAIDASSPLFGETPESMVASDSEIVVTILGIDGTTSQTVHAGTSYFADEVLFGQRFADTVRELPDGRIEVDVGKFDATQPTEPTAEFPYPKA
jgi:inward rectifier potassium channel